MREVYEYIRDELANVIGETVYNGVLPPVTGFALQVDSGRVATTFLTTGIVYESGFLFNAKGPDQADLLRKMTSAHLDLTQRKTWEKKDNWQILNVMTDSLPRLLGREDNINWEYGSGFLVRYFVNKESNE